MIRHLSYLTFALFCFCSLTIAQETDEQIATPQSEDTLTTKTLDSLDSKSRFLALEKGGKIKRVRFYEGERLYFRLKDDQMRYRPVIEEIGKDYIKVNNTALHLNEIASVTLYPERRLIRLMSQFLVIAGTGYFLIDMVNHSFSTTRESAIVSSSLASTGLALSLTLKPRKIRLNNKRYLKTIQKFE